jgi:hypothetical protein
MACVDKARLRLRSGGLGFAIALALGRLRKEPLAPTLAAQTSLQRSKGMPLRGHVPDWPTAANRRADGGLKLAFLARFQTTGHPWPAPPVSAVPVRPPRLRNSPRGWAPRPLGHTEADRWESHRQHMTNLAVSRTRQTTETPGRRSPPCGRHLSPQRPGPVGRHDQSRARRRKIRSLPRTASPTGWAPTAAGLLKTRLCMRLAELELMSDSLLATPRSRPATRSAFGLRGLRRRCGAASPSGCAHVRPRDLRCAGDQTTCGVRSAAGL